MSIWIGLIVILGAALLLALVVELRDVAQHRDGPFLDFYKALVASYREGPAGSGETWLRSPAGCFGTFAALIGAFLTLATFMWEFARRTDPTDISWFSVGLAALAVLYFLAGVWTSSSSGTVRAGLLAGSTLAGVSTAVIVLVTLLTGITWGTGTHTFLDYLAYAGVLLVLVGLPGLVVCAGGALLGRSRRRRDVARLAASRGKRGKRRRR